MKVHLIISMVCMFMVTACVSIPKETISLSKALKADIEILHSSHKAIVELYYSNIKSDVNTFVDEVYVPFVIHYVLQSELDKYKTGESSLYQTIADITKLNTGSDDETVITEMMDFQEAAYNQITAKRRELLWPIEQQEKSLLKAIDESYQNALYANATLTAYLESIKSVRKSQQNALQQAGVSVLDTISVDTNNEIAEQLSQIIKKGEQIDVTSKEAYQKIEELTNELQKLTTKSTNNE